MPCQRLGVGRGGMVHNDPEVAVIVLAPGPGLVDLADVAVFILRVHPAHGGGGVAIHANHGVLCPCFFPGAALSGHGVGFVANGKTKIVEVFVSADEVRDSPIAGGAEGGITAGLGGFESNCSELVAVGPIDHIPSEGFSGLESIFFVGLADADEGIGPGFVGGEDFLARDEVVVDDNLGLEAAVLAGARLSSL